MYSFWLSKNSLQLVWNFAFDQNIDLRNSCTQLQVRGYFFTGRSQEHCLLIPPCRLNWIYRSWNSPLWTYSMVRSSMDFWDSQFLSFSVSQSPNSLISYFLSFLVFLSLTVSQPLSLSLSQSLSLSLCQSLSLSVFQFLSFSVSQSLSQCQSVSIYTVP